VVDLEPLGIQPQRRIFAEAEAVAQRDAALVGAGIDDHPRALRVARRAREDVDDTVDRVGTPQRAARAADHLDAIDVVEHHVLHVPEHAGLQRRVDAAPVDQHQQLVGVAAVETARGDRVGVGVAARDLQVRCEAQGFGQGRHAGLADVFARDDVDRRWRIGQALRALGHRRNLDVGELLDRQVRQAGRRRGGHLHVGRHRGAVLCGEAQQHEGVPRRPPHGATSSSTVIDGSVNSFLASSTTTRSRVTPLR